MCFHNQDCAPYLICMYRQLLNSVSCKVWWYCSGLCFGRLAVHNVATSETKAIPVSQQMPAVVVMAQVSSSHFSATMCMLYLCQHFLASVNPCISVTS